MRTICFRRLRLTLATLATLLVVTFGFLPKTTWAEGVVCSGETTCDHVVAIGDQHYSSLADAFGQAQNGETITVLKSFSTSDRCWVSTNLKLDLCGHTITSTAPQQFISLNGESAELEINDTSGTGNGKISASGDLILTVIHGCLTVDNATIESTGTWLSGGSYWGNQIIYVLGSNEASASNYSDVVVGSNAKLVSVRESNSSQVGAGYAISVNVSGSSITHGYGVNVDFEGVADNAILYVNGLLKDAEGNVPAIRLGGSAQIDGGIYAAGYAKWTIDGATVSGPTGMEIRAGELTMSSGSIEGTSTPTDVQPNGNGSTTDGAGLAISQHTTKLPIKVNISGGSISGFTALYESNPQGNSEEELNSVELAVTGGTFKSINGGTNTVYSEDLSGFISGGTFSTRPSADYVTPLYVVNENADGTWTVAMHGHAAADDAAWHTDAASHWHTCGTDGCTEIVDKASHSFKWVIDKLPTAEAEGSRHQECTVCGYDSAPESTGKLPAQATDETAGTTGGATAQGAELDVAQTNSLAQQANEVSQAIQEATVSGGSASLGGVTVDIEGNQGFVDLVNGATTGNKVSTVLTVSAEQVEPDDVAQDAGRVDQAKSSNETATYLDLSVSMTVTVSDADGGDVRSATADVTSLAKPVTVTVAAPDGVDLSGFVRVARVHDGSVDILPCTVDAGAGTVTFSTDRFSTYALLTSDKAEVTFVLGNGQDPVVKKFGPGEAIVPPADPAREGYAFAGWFLTVDAEGRLSDPLADDAVASGPMVIYAGWVKSGASAGDAQGEGSRPATPETGAIPKTGDASSVMPAVAAAASGVAVLAGAVALRRRER